MSATIPTPAPRRPVSIRDLDADSTCCLPGFSCPACPPAGEVSRG